MTDVPSPSSCSIDGITIRGVGAHVAPAVAPAIEHALAAALASGRIDAGHRDCLRLTLPHGADAAAIAQAVVRALEDG